MSRYHKTDFIILPIAPTFSDSLLNANCKQKHCTTSCTRWCGITVGCATLAAPNVQQGSIKNLNVEVHPTRRDWCILLILLTTSHKALRPNTHLSGVTNLYSNVKQVAYLPYVTCVVWKFA